MNKITQALKSKLIPKFALIGYSIESEIDTISNDFYFELNSINKNGNIGSGNPLTIQSLTKIVSLVKETSKDVYPHGIIPKNLYYHNPISRESIWYYEPDFHFMYFTKTLNIENGLCHLPGLIFHVIDSSLKVYAYKGEISPETILYRAPVMNTGDTGSVCLGNAKAKKHEVLTFENYMKEWYDKLFYSEFSHISGINPISGNLILLMKELIGSSKYFPENVLVKSNIKLSNLIK